jgi:adenosylmethionine-8-amino-7-oxononanoate aminotransferase
MALLERRLEELVRPLPHVGDVRRAGLMVGIELVEDRVTKRSFPLARQTGALVARLAREHAVIMRPLGDVVVLMPPLAISPEDLDRLVRVTADCIARATA